MLPLSLAPMASVWRVPNPTTTNAILVRRIQVGKATHADLVAGGATQLGTVVDDYDPCTDNGGNCADDIYAASLSAVIPAANITWFQALAVCTSSGKRLLSLINDILDYSRLRHHDVILSLAPLDLRVAVDSVFAFARPLAGTKRIELINDVPATAPLGGYLR